MDGKRMHATQKAGDVRSLLKIESIVDDAILEECSQASGKVAKYGKYK